MNGRLWLVPMMFAAGAQAAMPVELSELPVPALTRVVGQRPAEFRIRAFKILQQFRRTPLLIELGGEQYHVSLQYSRDKDRQIVLLKQGGNAHRPAFAASLSALARSKAAKRAPLKGGPFYVRFDQRSYSFVFSRDAAGASVVRSISVSEVEKAIYATGVPLDSIGVDWRVTYQRELFQSAGRPSLVFMKDTRFGIQAVLVQAQAVDKREKIAALPDARVSLSFEGDDLIVRPIVDDDMGW
ncbi:MAG: hypothetical protein HY078_11520 [Elusimicrobia bacterium]|nr:hypothetical protein [Elusimicrobiota bacterium]